MNPGICGPSTQLCNSTNRRPSLDPRKQPNPLHRPRTVTKPRGRPPGAARGKHDGLAIRWVRSSEIPRSARIRAVASFEARGFHFPEADEEPQDIDWEQDHFAYGYGAAVSAF